MNGTVNYTLFGCAFVCRTSLTSLLIIFARTILQLVYFLLLPNAVLLNEPNACYMTISLFIYFYIVLFQNLFLKTTNYWHRGVICFGFTYSYIS